MNSYNPGPAGNHYDKFNTSNPLARHLMRGFTGSFEALFPPLTAHQILELGCGEGHMLKLMHTLHKDNTLHGLDIDMPILQQAQRECSEAHIILADGHNLTYPDNSFDLVVCCEVLEHVSDPEHVLKELFRVTKQYAILSVPHEPIWRILNVLRGRYISRWGDTPGHINHWSSTGFFNLVKSNGFSILEVRQPLPWTMVLCEISG